jgi:hypothetical protein
MTVLIAAQLFTVCTLVVILFQACLAAGLPWGAASMGGRFPGKYPPKMRVVAGINIAVLSVINAVVLARAGLVFTTQIPFADIAIWVVAAFFALGTVMNTITPSRIERIWAPVALVQCVASVVIALS